MHPDTATDSLRRDQGSWLLGAAALTLAPHVDTLPTWVAVLAFGLLGWRASLLWRGRMATSKWLVLMLALAAGIAVRFEFGHFFGKDPGVALLAILLGLKLLETRTMRDIHAAVLLCFFLQLAVFLENQSPLFALLALGACLLSIGSLLALTDPHASQRERLRTSALLLVQGLPFMLILFVLFPRVQGPLWGLPADAHRAVTGLSDSMSPGSIAELSQSSEIAFRAAFEEAPPPPHLRYWRGPVLTHFDGSTWRASRHERAEHPYYTPAGPQLRYQLTLEAHNQHWLLAMDFAGGPVDGIRFGSDYQALSVQPVRTRSRFELNAYPETPVGLDESSRVLDSARRLPADGNPRSRQLVAELSADTPTPAILLERVIDYLRQSELRYTLRPPLMREDSVDTFLFVAQRGFCEHFSSAFVFLMRAAGVPARVVTGYQGGEINPVDGSLVVRQSDAHAWAEVWLDGRGWVRVDPTALAAPQRIESGLSAALPASEALPLLMRPEMAWLRTLRHQWDAASNHWNQWVLGYNQARQLELLSELGLDTPRWQVLIGGMMLAVLVVMAALLAWAMHYRNPADALDKAWAAFSRKLAHVGLERHPAEGPLDYGARLARARPLDASALQEITSRYAALRYRPPAPVHEVLELKRRIRKLNLR